jgi:hypothetical protein
LVGGKPPLEDSKMTIENKAHCASKLPIERPLEFAKTELHGQAVWMICRPQPKLPPGYISDFHRYQICKELYTTSELEEIYQVALYQNESTELLAWIRQALESSKSNVQFDKTSYPCYFTDPKKTNLVVVQFAPEGVVYVQRPEGMYEVISHEMADEELNQLKESFCDRKIYPKLMVDIIEEAVKQKNK